MARLRAALWISALAGMGLLLGCGGATDGGLNDPAGGRGPGGSSSGGASAGASASGAAGAIGGSPSAGSSSAGAAGATCCGAFPVCGPGEVQISGPEACPPGASCREAKICCSSIWCADGGISCTAVPVCDPGDTEIRGECPPARACYSRTLCGATITCAGPEKPGTCDPENEPDRRYIARGNTCLLIDFGCPANTYGFYNDCGCGCEQDAACPDAIDCSRGAAPDPYCSADGIAKCPYTVRGL